MDLDGNIRLKKDLFRAAASISPDGKWIAYGTETGLELTDLDGNSQSFSMQTLNTSNGDLSVFWFPDGQRLVLVYEPGLIHSIYPEATAYTLAILNRADGSVVTLASDVSRVSEPSFALSPDSSWILYRRRDGVNYCSTTDGFRTDPLPAMGGHRPVFLVAGWVDDLLDAAADEQPALAQQLRRFESRSCRQLGLYTALGLMPVRHFRVSYFLREYRY